MKNRRNGEGCLNCYFRRKLFEGATACHYAIDMGELRGCPPGKGCTRFRIRGKKTERELRNEQKHYSG